MNTRVFSKSGIERGSDAGKFLIGTWLSWTLLSSSIYAQSIAWEPLGASPNTGGQMENVTPNNEVVGAINAIAVHPTNADILYVGAVNGGIWKSENAMALAPTWTVLTDEHESLSIGAIEFDPTDQSNKTLVAGSGGNSSFGASGTRIGVLRTTDGINWKLLDGMGALTGLNISGVVPRGDVIVISASNSESSAKAGIWRSLDAGATWKLLSGIAGTGLPTGRSFEVCGDPLQKNIIYAHTVAGLFKSSDTGETWSGVGDVTFNQHVGASRNAEISVGHHQNVFVATVGVSQQLSGVFRSGDAGATWKSMGVPSTEEGGIHPGRQGSLHLSLTAEPSDANIVYIGGDRQAANGFPNSIGANDWSGRLFRGDASLADSRIWAHLTHSNALGNPLGGTAHVSAPHADSRAMAVAVNGVLVEGDDGGVYRRTSPKDNTGDWFSANGDLQNSEYHAIAWDSNANIIVAGAQDTGSSEQILNANKQFRSISTADGGVVAVDDKTTLGRSVRYSSYQELEGFRRRTFDETNTQLSSVFVPMTPLGGVFVTPQFYTPLALNHVTPIRLVIGGANGIFESLNRGDTVRLIGPGIVANEGGHDPIAYGATDNPDGLYVGAGTSVFVRSSGHPAVLVSSTTYPGSFVQSIVMDPDHWKTAYVIDPTQVLSTTDGGATWTDLTANLATLKPRVLRCLALIPGSAPILLVGSDKGVFGRTLNSQGSWSRLATGLPKVPVYHLEYDHTDQILVAGTLGRGAWTIAPQPPTPIPQLLAQALAQAGQPGVLGAAIPAQDAPTSPPVTFADGILIDPRNSTIVLMRPVDEANQGSVESVNIVSGETQWRSADGEKPLDINSGRVIAQAWADEQNGFKLSVLNGQTGQELVSQTQSLVGATHCSIDETSDGTFMAMARSTGENEVVSWHFNKRILQGIRPGVLESLPEAEPAAAGENLAPNRIGTSSGTLQFDLRTGELQPLNVAAPSPAMAAMAVDSVEEFQLDGVEGDQAVTLDGGHVVASILVGDDTVFEKYKLSIHDKATGERVGVINSHTALPRLYVNNDRIIVLHDAHSRTEEGKMTDVPMTLLAFSMDGNEVWSREVRDTEFRGPYPP